MVVLLTLVTAATVPLVLSIIKIQDNEASHQLSIRAWKEFEEKFGPFERDEEGHPILPFYPILIPVYGHPEYLQQTVRGLQRVQNLEKVRVLL